MKEKIQEFGGWAEQLTRMGLEALKETDPEGKGPENFCFFFDLDDDLNMADYGKGTKFGCIHCKFLPFEKPKGKNMKVTICSGASGSGKSTWAKAQKGAVIVSADDFFMVDGEYKFDRPSLPEAHNQCQRNYVERLRSAHLQEQDPSPEDREIHLIVDNTNTTVAEVAVYWSLAQAYGVEVIIRQFTGEYENVHGVPAKAVEAMRKRAANLKRYAPPWWSFEEE